MSPRALGWVLVAAAAVGAGLLRPGHAHAPLPAGARLLGPLRHAAADVLWLRAEAARREGLPERVISRSLAALALAPEATAGWDALAHYQALVLGSTLHEPDAARRRLWLQAGLDTARTGEARAERPEELAFLRGILLQTHAENDPETDWPGGTRGLWAAAAEAYGEAQALGHGDAAPLAETARARASGELGS